MWKKAHNVVEMHNFKKFKITQTSSLGVLLLISALLSGCAVRKTSLETADGVDGASLKQLLAERYHEWRAVRYRWGGLSKAGVDCSGFVYLTFLDLFGLALPRTVYHQAKIGQTISRRQLRTGDLVFFRTGRRRGFHVGIYYEDRRFLHVSSRQGVTLSQLNNRYWSRRYWKAVRIKIPYNEAEHSTAGRRPKIVSKSILTRKDVMPVDHHLSLEKTPMSLPTTVDRHSGKAGMVSSLSTTEVEVRP